MGFLEVKPEIFRTFLEKFRKDFSGHFSGFLLVGLTTSNERGKTCTRCEARENIQPVDQFQVRVKHVSGVKHGKMNTITQYWFRTLYAIHCFFSI